MDASRARCPSHDERAGRGSGMPWLTALEAAPPAPTAEGGQGQKSISFPDFLASRHRMRENVARRPEEGDDKDCRSSARHGIRHHRCVPHGLYYFSGKTSFTAAEARNVLYARSFPPAFSLRMARW